jgi:glutamyl-tRNA reductase
MSIVVIGVNHRTGPLELLERLAIPAADQAKALTGLTARESIREAVVLSTCNRTEVYAVAERFHGAYADIRDFFCDVAGLDPNDLQSHLYSQHDDAAVTHLFEVAAGLDSAVLGESEILGQVRSAWELAQVEGAAKATLNLLFRHAIETGKRARTETSIGRGTASVSHAAVEMASERLGSLTGRRVLVLGAGEVGEGIAAALVHAGVSDIGVVNRSVERARTLASRISGSVVQFADLGSELAHADLLLTCTGAGVPVVDLEMVTAARITSRAPLLIVDVAVPRDVAPEVTALDNVTLLNLDDIRDWAGRALVLRAEEARRVHQIVTEQVDHFAVEATARQAAPLVAQLHDHAETIRRAEIERFSARLANLDESQRATLEAITKGIVAKLLHTPSVKLKDDAGTPQGQRNAATIRDLFDLG